MSNKNALFIGLDEVGSMYRVNQPWLEAQLAANRPMHTFVFGHMPAFPCSSHIGSSLDAYPTNRNAFWSSLEAGGVRVYFCGHEHFYDRADVGNGDSNSANDLTDTDGDGMLEWMEYVAGTCPTSGESVLAITNARATVVPDARGFLIQWPSPRRP